MNFTENRNLTRWIFLISSFVIICLILWNTYTFSQHFKAEERNKMEHWTAAYEDYKKYANGEISEINAIAERIVIDSTVTTPLLLLDKADNLISYRNIEEHLISDSIKIKKLKQRLTIENSPLDIDLGGTQKAVLYHGNSPMLNKLKYYPLALLLIITLFSTLAYFFYRSSRIAAQNKLWSGMAKETAHQIGTPLSSLVGWAEILKTENVDPSYIAEIEKDITRLQTITDRFSKIGSIPTLEHHDIVKTTTEAFDYIKSRSSKLINFKLNTPKDNILVNLNVQLFSWTIENLVKNGIDAMKGKGDLSIEITSIRKQIQITISDTGKGIPKQLHKTIFEPGYTSKRRGWGLGLSLAKRIIEDYHNGKIKVLRSEIDNGTTIQITLKQLNV
ncbi:MAG: HAMP domain-containing histidine kinase [Flavobacteriaceae bacterium]|nr:HAMP domain-containing histidine kinase [Flavobacteriaceae bacterium]